MAKAQLCTNVQNDTHVSEIHRCDDWLSSPHLHTFFSLSIHQQHPKRLQSHQRRFEDATQSTGPRRPQEASEDTPSQVDCGEARGQNTQGQASGTDAQRRSYHHSVCMPTIFSTHSACGPASERRCHPHPNVLANNEIQRARDSKESVGH